MATTVAEIEYTSFIIVIRLKLVVIQGREVSQLEPRAPPHAVRIARPLITRQAVGAVTTNSPAVQRRNSRQCASVQVNLLVTVRYLSIKTCLPGIGNATTLGQHHGICPG
jgi:hypothetical protein